MRSLKFICDSCGKPIEDIQSGHMEWIDDCEHPSHSFHICHNDCQKLADHPDASCGTLDHYAGARAKAFISDNDIAGAEQEWLNQRLSGGDIRI